MPVPPPFFPQSVVTAPAVGAPVEVGGVVIRRSYAPESLRPVSQAAPWGERAGLWIKPLLILATLAWGGNAWWSSRPVSHAPGMLVAETPHQRDLPAGAKPWEFKGCEIRPLAAYDITARVVHRERYRFDGMSDISPLDLGVGWLLMSDQRYLDVITFTNSGRFLNFNSAEAGLPWSVIQTCAANMHIIPANDGVLDAMLALREGQVFRATGSLVEVTRPGVTPWRSSLSREDSGNGACEIMWVEWVKPEP